MRIILLFPPNWSAVTNSPHLALPLLAGSILWKNCKIKIWDLNKEFYDKYGKQPDNNEIINACNTEDIETLNRLYFDWEDDFTELACENEFEFGLISGFHKKIAPKFDGYYSQIKRGTVFSKFYDRNVYPFLKEENPSFIGISISSSNQLLSTIELLIGLKKYLSKTKIILGGNVVTRLKKSTEFQKIKELADYIVYYQGEKAINRICNLKFTPSLNTYSDEFIPSSEWPIPFFEGLNLKEYIGIPTLPFVSTRGCYWGKCSFCAIPAGWSKNGYAGSMPPELMSRQIKHLVQKYNIDRIKFVDESFPPSKVIPFSNLVYEYNFNFHWEAYVRLERQWEDENLLRIAHEAGCRKLYFGLELSSFSRRDFFKKNDNANIVTILEECKKVGILVHIFCMVGHPRTTKKDAHTTVDFLIEHQQKIDTADIVGFQLHRGISIKDITLQQGQENTYLLIYDYLANNSDILLPKEVQHLESECQERIWDEVPRLLHPLYRIGKIWEH